MGGRMALTHTLFNIRWRCGFSRLHVGRHKGWTGRLRRWLPVLAVLPLRIFLPTIAAGIGVAPLLLLPVFSWVELLLAKTLTSVAAKPIAP